MRDHVDFRRARVRDDGVDEAAQREQVGAGVHRRVAVDQVAGAPRVAPSASHCAVERNSRRARARRRTSSRKVRRLYNFAP